MNKMEQLELEKLLEAGFYALGVEFSRRKYGEEIRVASEVDDQFEDMSVKKARPKKDDPKYLAKRLLAEFGLTKSYNKLTEDQRHVYEESVPFFKRKAETLDGMFSLDYCVYSTKTLDNYEAHADELIEQRKILAETIDIDLNLPKGKLGLASITTYFDSYPKQADDTFVTKKDLEEIFEEIPEFVSKMDRKLTALKESDLTLYDPKKIYQAVMDFFSTEGE
jgi:hypothetical protein